MPALPSMQENSQYTRNNHVNSFEIWPCNSRSNPKCCHLNQQNGEVD